MTQTARTEFTGVLRVAGPNEAARAQRLLQRVTVVADGPSLRALGLRVTGSLEASDIVILGTGDQLGITTLTADGRALRAAAAQGVPFDALLHDSQPLRGLK